MKAILTYTVMENGTLLEKTKLFDTDKSEKLCNIRNSFGKIAAGIYISEGGVLFKYYFKEEKLEVPDQKKCKEWLGEHEPDKYIEFFGKPEEA